MAGSIKRGSDYSAGDRPSTNNRSRCRFGLLILAGTLAMAPVAGAASTARHALTRAQQLEQKGQFQQASVVLQQALASDLPAKQHKELEFELDRLERIKMDYPFTQQSLFAALQKSVSGLTADEYQKWVADGRFDSREIDGKRWFMGSSVANLFFRYPELDSRRMNHASDAAVEKAMWQTCRDIEQVAKDHGPYVLPQRIDATMTVTADADAAPAGKTIRAWLPIPRQYPYQKDFKMISTEPAIKQIAPPDSPIRSVYFEQTARAGEPTVFKIHYQYTHYGVRFDIDPAKVTPFDSSDSTLAHYTRQAPNIVFTPQIKALSKKIAGDEKNPAILARKFYDWISNNTRYSYSIEYSTIRNLSAYCLSHRYGDCGEEGILFITLCRLNGIPARWQSGWDIYPGAQDMHDWTEIYLAPYGWVPVDPYMGLDSAQYMTALSPQQRELVHNFYFGGLDQWRLAANSEQSQTLSPPKKSVRSDNIDFQRGELEWDNHNIYFNHYNYRLIIKPAK